MKKCGYSEEEFVKLSRFYLSFGVLLARVGVPAIGLIIIILVLLVVWRTMSLTDLAITIIIINILPLAISFIAMKNEFPLRENWIIVINHFLEKTKERKNRKHNKAEQR